MRANIPLLETTLLDLTRRTRWKDPMSMIYFILDDYSFGERESMFFELNRFLDNLYFDPTEGKVHLRNMNKEKASGVLMNCIEKFGEFVLRFKQENTLGVKNHIDAHSITLSEESTQDDQSPFLTEEQHREVKAFEITCQYIKEHFIAPIFKERYGMEYPSEKLAQPPSGRITYGYDIPFPERNTPINSLRERIFNQIGLFSRNIGSTVIGRDHLHVLETHGSQDFELMDSSTDVKLDGGDVLLAVCYQDTDRAINLLEKLTESSIHRESGIIHLRNRESLCVSTATHGTVYLPQSRGANNNSQEPNPFVRSTLRSRNQPFGNRTYTTDTGQQVYLQRSNSGQRLYLGGEENYFENCFELLEQNYRERMAAYKSASNTPKRYECSIDFERLSRMQLTERNIDNLNRFINDQKLFQYLYGRTVNPEGNRLQERSIMVLLKTGARGEDISKKNNKC